MPKYGYNSDDMLRAFFCGLFLGAGLILGTLWLTGRL